MHHVLPGVPLFAGGLVVLRGADRRCAGPYSPCETCARQKLAPRRESEFATSRCFRNSFTTDQKAQDIRQCLTIPQTHSELDYLPKRSAYLQNRVQRLPYPGLGRKVGKYARAEQRVAVRDKVFMAMEPARTRFRVRAWESAPAANEARGSLHSLSLSSSRTAKTSCVTSSKTFK